jgi:penicillin G amidase
VRRLGVVLGIVAGLLVVLLVVLTGVAWWQVRRGYPSYDGQVALPGLVGEVEVVRDELGIPTIYADTPEDLFRAQGYVHAQDRFWEMDFRRLLAAGRLSEIAGESAVETDVFLRSLGWRRIAEAEVGLLSPEALRSYEAYAEGVNAWLDQTPPGQRGIQYTLLGLQGPGRDPEPWTVADSLSFIRVVAWDLRHNVDQEAERAVLASLLSPEQLRTLYPGFPYDEMGTILTSQDLEQQALTGRAGAARPAALPAAAVPALQAAAATIGSVPGASAGGGVGSNSWVVGGDRTASGAGLLANDPHLGPSIPGLFTQVHLRCRVVSEQCPFDVQGFSAASLPGVAIGHNADIAWGWTTPYVDTGDLYLEQVDGEEYLTEDGMVPLQTRTETIQVAGGDPVEVTLRSTRHGPLLTSQDVSSSFALPDLERVGAVAEAGEDAPPRGAGYEVALRWTGSEPGRTGEALFALNTASNWDEFRSAIELINAFPQNIVYADAEGGIGYYIFGSIPIRSGYDGYLPVPGWTGEYDWVSQVPFESQPHVLDPARGYLATANETPVPPEYPYLLTSDAQFAYRGDRIRAALEADADVTVEEAAALQMDSWSWLAERLVPALLEVDGLDGYYAEGQALLEEWDYRQEPDSAAAAYFNATYARILALTFRDELPEDYWPTGRGRWFVVLDTLMDDPTDPFWDDVTTPDVVETRDAVLRQALIEARDELTESQSKDPKNWEWGRMHVLDLVDPAFGESGIGPVEWLFNRGPYPAGGGGNIVLANAWDANTDSYVLTNIPTFRMVVDFGDLDASRWVNQSGQSGHPGHPHYDDQIARWQSGDSAAMTWTDEAVDAAAVHTLTLTPAAG